MIDARIRKRYKGGTESASFELDVHVKSAARVTVLYGPSGAGKSQTLDAIAGFMRPDQGRILVDDVLLFDQEAGVSLSPQRRRCGYVFQSSALFPHMSLRGNLSFAAERLPKAERRQRVNEMLEQFHLESVSGRMPGELSGGQRQRGSIARALLSQPRVLLLDEPSSGLDAALREELYRLLAEVQASVQIPIVLVTHDLDEALQLGGEMFVMQHGRVVQQGPPAGVLDQPANEEVAGMTGRYNVFDAEILTMDPGANRSRLRCMADSGAAFEIDGPYFPGLLLGARLRLGIRADLLAVSAYGAAGVRLRLARTNRRTQTVRCEFANGLVAELPERSFDAATRQIEWVVQFPPEALRVLR